MGCCSCQGLPAQGTFEIGRSCKPTRNMSKQALPGIQDPLIPAPHYHFLYNWERICFAFTHLLLCHLLPQPRAEGNAASGISSGTHTPDQGKHKPGFNQLLDMSCVLLGNPPNSLQTTEKDIKFPSRVKVNKNQTLFHVLVILFRIGVAFSRQAFLMCSVN